MALIDYSGYENVSSFMYYAAIYEII